MAPTFFQWAYLGMVISGAVIFAIVVNWATARTVPSQRRETGSASVGLHARA